MQNFTLKRLEHSVSGFASLHEQWEGQCRKYGDSFNAIEAGLPPQNPNTPDETLPGNQGTYGLVDSAGEYHGICFLNLTVQKPFDGKVLRALNFRLSPFYVYEDLEIEDYSKVLSGYFANLVLLSNTELASQHIKIQYSSPYDRQFFAVIAPYLSGVDDFVSVESKGMWLSITKC